MSKSFTRVLIVGLNVTKHEAYAFSRNNQFIRVAQGVYFHEKSDVGDLFDEFGIRLANYFFANAALTHSTAWYKRPMSGRVFVGGDYPYKKIIAPGAGDFRVVQTMVHPNFDDDRMYELYTFTDSLGEFDVYCATQELTIIHLMDATKHNIDKHLPDVEMDDLYQQLLKRHGSKAALLTQLEKIAIDADKVNEFERLLRRTLSTRR